MNITVQDILESPRTRRAIVMGILNVTPDSFSDGGAFFSPAQAVSQARRMLEQGAGILDLGAESTRPGAERVSAAEQIARLREILPEVVQLGAVISIDTTRTQVAEFALDAGAQIVNDVSAGRDDPDMFALVAERNVPIVLMHMLGQPKTMQAEPHYADVVTEVRDFLLERVSAARKAGIPRERCILDPGIGFGKQLEHNLALMAGIPTFCETGLAVLVGPSRKRFIGELTGKADPAERLGGTVGACLACRGGGATLFRVHDVAATVDALSVFDAIGQVR